MRTPSIVSSLLLAGAVAASTGCQSETEEDSTAWAATDSTALAVAVAEALGADIARSAHQEGGARRALRLEPGGTEWDSLLARELERVQTGMSPSETDAADATVLSTHGFEERGDTVSVTIVISSCAPADTSLNFSKDSLVHRFVRADATAGGWRVAGPVMRDFSIGVCGSADSANASPA